MTTQRVLLIGAGAVGQVYGYHFQRGGAEIGFYVREKYAADAREGFNLYPLNRRNPRQAPVRFDGFAVHTDMAEALSHKYDTVVLCLSSTALRKGTWLDELAANLGDATLVNLCPGIKDYAYICERVAAEQVVNGLIGFSSYPGPMDGETLPEPGMEYWVPPFAKMPFSGPRARTASVIAALNAGGLKSKEVADVSASTAFSAPVLQFHIVAMELTGWTFPGLFADKALMKLVHQAMKQAFGIAEKAFDVKTPLAMRMLRPWVMRLVMRGLRFAPLDMAKFFQLHFTKVGDQTEFGLRTRIDVGKSHGLPVDAIEALHARLVAFRAGDTAATSVVEGKGEGLAAAS